MLFTVQSPTPHYWRLTALDDFDGRSWSASARYRDLDSQMRIDSPWTDEVPVTQESIRVAINTLHSDWLPTAFAPVRVDAPIDLRFDAASSSVFVADDEDTEKVTYTVKTAVADLERLPLTEATSPIDPKLKAELALPAKFPQVVREKALALTNGLTPFEQATALETFFREQFTYDRTVDYRDAPDPLSAFLEDGRGFCQQFSTAFAAMARSVGLPSRVAVGFTYGEPTTSGGVVTGDAEITTWTVRGRYAHAWPEVYFHDIGWVPFEPTPGRGNPDSTGYSDVRPSQSDALGGVQILGETTTTTTTTTAVPPAGGVVPTTLPDALPERGADGAATSGEPSRTPLVVMAALVGLGLLVFALGAARIRYVRHRRAHRRHGTVDAPTRVETSWRDTCRDLARVDVVHRGAETPIEFGVRAARTMEVKALARLGRAESDRRFRGRPVADDEAQLAEEISDEVRTVVWSRLDRRQRLAAELDLGRRRDE